jgi:D-alanine-D-alanine ligase
VKITVLHNAVTDTDSAAERDVLAQVAAVEQTLQGLGHATNRLACTLNLEAVEEALVREQPQLVFNLVGSLGGSDRLAHLAAVLLDDFDLPYTGTPADGFHLTNNKPLAKRRLRAAGLPTAEWTVLRADGGRLTVPYIIKATWENASVGLDDHAVILSGDGELVREQIASRSRQLGYSCFAEQFIDGREFNLSLLATPDGPRVLPPAEIDFRNFPEGRQRIVGYAAKQGDGVGDGVKISRIFEFSENDGPLLNTLRELALECWRLFGLAGYASIDFRVDEHGQPWILEINANPSLAYEGGFVAALAREGLSLSSAVEWIIQDADRPRAQEPEVGAQQSEIGDQKSEVRDQKSEVGKQEGGVIIPDAHDSPTHHSPPTTIKLRSKPKRTDGPKIRELVAASSCFRDSEIDGAVELLQERLKKGSKSTSEFLFAEEKKTVVGYVCYGKNSQTASTFEIHWLAVEPGQQRRGIGHLLLTEAERQIATAGGTQIFLRTSQRDDFRATREFYERRGYKIVAVLNDFYAPGDGQATYQKTIDSPSQPFG